MPSEVKNKLDTVKDTVCATVGQVKGQLDEGKNTVQDKIEEVRGQGESLAHLAWEQVPAPMAGRLTRLARGVRQRPVPAAATVFTVLIFLLLRRFLRGGKR